MLVGRDGEALFLVQMDQGASLLAGGDSCVSCKGGAKSVIF